MKKNSAYHKQCFYIRLHERYWDKECCDKDAVTLAKELPKLEALVSERAKQDKRKLALINEHVMNFLNEHNISISELKEHPNGIAFSFTDNRLDFIRDYNLIPSKKEKFLSEAEKLYKGYILRSDCWRVAYYDYLQRHYDKILDEAKMILHERFMNDVKSVI